MAAGDDRREEPIASSSPQTEVLASVVSVHLPLPASMPAHPAACDWLQYQRFRARGGPQQSTEADAVVALIPGMLEGATAFDPVARNAVIAAAARGKHIEIWAIDRRANCLEDHTGVDAATRSGDLQQMIDYEYRGREIDGRRFAGFAQPARSRILPELGLAQTVRDYHDLLVSELPDQAWRERHLVCGGHSLGGPITRAFAEWDFDGDPATTDDAGYRQCAGFFGLETRLTGNVLGGTAATSTDALTGGLVRAVQNTSLTAMRRGLIPGSVDVFGIGPETAALLEGLGLAADLAPNEDWWPLISQVPHSATVDTFLRLHGSATWSEFLFSGTTTRSSHYTNMAALGQATDDNGSVIAVLRASFGAFDDTAVVRNRVPGEMGKVPTLGTLFGRGTILIPRHTSAARPAQWRNYNEVPAGSTSPSLGATGPGLEVTDAHEFARITHEGPLDMTEQFFPVRLLLDVVEMESGTRDGSLAPMVHTGAITMRPRFVVLGSDGLIPATTRAPEPQIVLTGYNHMDVLTAAAKQNDGRPERSSQALASFAISSTRAR